MFRTAVGVVALALAIPGSVPSATGAPLVVEQPAIKIMWDARCPIVGDRAVIPWSWTKRSGLQPDDTLTIQYRPYGKGIWTKIVSDVRLDNNRKGSRRLEGRYVWDASKINPGRVARYEARVIVQQKRLVSPVYAFWIDHVPPKVWITEPAAMFEVPGPDGKPISATVARGIVNFRASVIERPKAACNTVLWKWMDPVMTFGPSRDLKSMRITQPWPGVLWAVAVDRAGNETYSEPLYILAFPGNDESYGTPARFCVVPVELCTPRDTGITPPA